MTGSLQTAVGGPLRACEGWWHERSPWSRSYCTEECWPRPQLLASLAARDSHRDVRRLSTAFTTKGPSSCTQQSPGSCYLVLDCNRQSYSAQHSSRMQLQYGFDCIRKRQEGEHDLWASPDWPGGGFDEKGVAAEHPPLGDRG